MNFCGVKHILTLSGEFEARCVADISGQAVSLKAGSAITLWLINSDNMKFPTFWTRLNVFPIQLMAPAYD